MKNKILTFVIGVLVGAIITTVGFLIYEKVKGDNQTTNETMPQMMQDGEGQMTPPDMSTDESGNNQMTPQQMPGGEMSNNQGTPPEKPSGEMSKTRGTPPQAPSNNNSQSSNTNS